MSLSKPAGASSSRPTSRPKLTASKKAIFSRTEINLQDPAVCEICEDGGQLILCDGPCERHFHASRQDPIAQANKCPTLEKWIARNDDQDKGLHCPDCKRNQFACFVCNQYRTMENPEGSRPAMLRCTVPHCNKFYCPGCALLLDREEGDKVGPFDKDAFRCARHYCQKCRKPEGKDYWKMLLCKRCPTAYHPECVPGTRVTGEVWRHLDNGKEKSWFYCGFHGEKTALKAPERDHVKYVLEEIEKLGK